MQQICPEPRVWNKIYIDLKRKWVESGQEGVQPPTPLVVDLWAYSSDTEKAQRWQETLVWALEHSCYSIISRVRDEQMYTGVA